MVSATRIETTAYGTAALERLQDVVAGLKSDDPMKPVTLLLPNNLAGVAARRFLAQTGIAGLFLATLPRLAEQLAARTARAASPGHPPDRGRDLAYGAVEGAGDLHGRGGPSVHNSSACSSPSGVARSQRHRARQGRRRLQPRP